MSGFLDTLRERGFIEQTTDEAALEKLFSEGGDVVSAYIGFDPSSSSLHVGSLVPIMALVHLQRAGHRPIALLGGGTGRVGDPSGKTEMRKLLGEDSVDENLAGISSQLSRYLELGEPGGDGGGENTGFAVDNAGWLLELNYVDFLRDIGRHFSVNRMLSAESVKLRIDSESGLSFLEFNYSILQAYDFLVLNQRHGCQVQMGGSDQWGNIVAGIDLIRRVDGAQAYGITFPLITTAGGSKMGKTEAGAVWLDAERTSAYDYYQFWINTDDRDVGRFLRLFTLLPVDEIQGLEALEGADIRDAKGRLAFEATALNHGREAAEQAAEAARALFSSEGGGGDSVPTHQVSAGELEEGIAAIQLFNECGLCDSKGAARRLARQGGLYVNDEKAEEDRVLTSADLDNDCIMLRAGKKKHRRIEVSS
ncbi:MAG: tyrosine--tRNA ligase [Planctomycetota bacterium]|nr:tyrosine--tRNA ligase [Planctomycetota bacterium]